MTKCEMHIPRSTAHASEGGSAAAAAPLARPSLAALLTGHILHDGEVVLLILKPSLWFVLLSSLRFIAAVLVFVLAGLIWDDMGGRSRVYVNAAILLAVARLTWATLIWMSRVYVLTDLRIVRLSGVFTVEIFDCPLRKVARVRQVTPVKERLVWCGTLEITPLDEDIPVASWQTIAQPAEVHKQIMTAIRRARHGGQ